MLLKTAAYMDATVCMLIALQTLIVTNADERYIGTVSSGKLL
jgi:hypothetical protein